MPRIIPGGNGVSNSFFVDDAEYRELLWDRFQANAAVVVLSFLEAWASQTGN